MSRGKNRHRVGRRRRFTKSVHRYEEGNPLVQGTIERERRERRMRVESNEPWTHRYGTPDEDDELGPDIW